MKITWLGHASFRLEIADQIILIDPWLDGNPSFPNDQREAAIQGATHILLTHAHDDHATDALALAKSDGLVLVGQFDLMNWWETSDKIKTIGMNKGGTIKIGDVAVSMVNAVHSSTLRAPDGSLRERLSETIVRFKPLGAAEIDAYSTNRTAIQTAISSPTRRPSAPPSSRIPAFRGLMLPGGAGGSSASSPSPPASRLT